MQFFSRYSYIWKFPKEQENAYAQFLMPANRAYLRLVSFITLFGMSLFLVVDFFKEVEFSVVLTARGVALVVALFTLLISLRKTISVRVHFACIALLMYTNLGASMITATLGGMPPYYITNLLFLMFVLVVTASGLNFRHAIMLNISCIGAFLIFSQFIKRDPFYFSQYAHLFSIMIYILIVGAVLESRRRLAFLNFKELEEKKKQVEVLNQQKNKIISILSHDIAAPLNSLTGLLSLQTRGLVEHDQIGPYVSQVGERLENVHVLLQSLMRWSKSQLDGFVPDKKIIDIVESINKIGNQFTSQLQEKSLSLRIEPDKPVYAMVDQDMMIIALRNLISNAIKFSKFQHSVKVTIKPEKERITIKISNSGDPIPEEQKKKLFTYGISSMIGTGGETGTGLGLAMSAYFIQLNGGRVYLDDSIQNENVFCVELPAEI